MTRKTKSRPQGYTVASAQPVEAKLAEYSRAVNRRNKEEAEKPLYLARV